MRVAAVQLTSTADLDRNVERADRFTRAAAADGAELVVLPEKWSVIGRGDDLRAGAQALDGPVVTWARSLARELGVELVAGSICERAHSGERMRNTSLHIGPDGEIQATYRKVHMFDVVVDGTTYRESDHEQAGDEIVTSETAAGVGIGLSVCYDVRFPELYRILALQGARILIVPAAFTRPTGQAHWDTLLRARAIENQAFVVAAGQVGTHPPDNESFGGSQILDPWGDVLARAPDASAPEECFVAADLDLERQDEVREMLPSLANRVPSAYRWPQEVRA